MPIFFLGVGAQKSGTSWLSHYFKGHPEILMSPIKEMHFFGNRKSPNLKRFKRQLAFQEVQTAFTGNANKTRINHLNNRISVHGDIERYKDYFSKMLKTEKAYGEISPAYAFLDKNELTAIYDNFPNCRIIFLMRNPVDRAWSQMRFSHIDDTLETLHEKALQRMSEQAYVLRSDYKRTVENLVSVFPRDQIHFAFFEHLFNQDAVNKICDFLEVRHEAADLITKRNAAYAHPLDVKLRHEMKKILKPQYAFVDAYFKSEIPTCWQDDLRAIG